MFNSTVPGSIVDERYRSHLGDFLKWRETGVAPNNGLISASTYSLTQQQYEAVMRFMEQWGVRSDYTKSRMCGTFVQGMIRAAGYSPPTGDVAPSDLYDYFRTDGR